MKETTFARTAAGMAAGALLLVACGGGGGGTPADPPLPGTDVPLSATTSSEGAVAFLKSVTAVSDSTGEPLVVGDVTLATSDNTEPDPSI